MGFYQKQSPMLPRRTHNIPRLIAAVRWWKSNNYYQIWLFCAVCLRNGYYRNILFIHDRRNHRQLSFWIPATVSWVNNRMNSSKNLIRSILIVELTYDLPPPVQRFIFLFIRRLSFPSFYNNVNNLNGDSFYDNRFPLEFLIMQIGLQCVDISRTMKHWIIFFSFSRDFLRFSFLHTSQVESHLNGKLC